MGKIVFRALAQNMLKRDCKVSTKYSAYFPFLIFISLSKIPLPGSPLKLLLWRWTTPNKIILCLKIMPLVFIDITKLTKSNCCNGLKPQNIFYKAILILIFA